MFHFIMTFISFAGIVTCVCVALYGWGLLFHRIARFPVGNVVVTIIIGLATIIFFGGVLNLLRFAYGWTFDSLLIVGILLAVIYGKLEFKLPHGKSQWFYIIIICLLIIMIMGFTVNTQLPPKAFNWHDDLEKYFAHPVRMLQTGTLFGSTLSSLGLSILGGQAVLHGIVLYHFPIPYINGVDAAFGLFLCLISVVSIFPMRTAFLPISLIGLLIVFFINPQYVNISALYIASALMMASIMLFSNIHEYENGKTENLPSPILIGLIYAALVAIKSTFVIYPLLHVSIFIIALKLYGVDFRRIAYWVLTTAAMTSLFLLPWILLYLPNYINLSFAQTPVTTDIILEEFPNLLSTQPLFYGASFAHYTFIVIAIALSVFFITFLKHRKRVYSGDIASAGLVASVAAIVVAYLLLIYLGSMLGDYGTRLRYTIPFLIAGAPIILSLVYLWTFRGASSSFKLFFMTIPLLLGILIVISFSDTLMDRIHQAYEKGSIIAFSQLATRPEYIEYNENVLYGDTRSRILAAQEQIPAGQAIMAWVYAPFYLDYKRNVIYDVDLAGILNPWAHIPEDVNYFIIEYNGPAVRSLPDERCVAFIQYLQKIMQNADVLYNDGKIGVFKKRGG